MIGPWPLDVILIVFLFCVGVFGVMTFFQRMVDGTRKPEERDDQDGGDFCV